MSDHQPLRAEVIRSPGHRGLDRRPAGQIRRIENQTAVRVIGIEAEAIVATEKNYEFSRVTESAMGNHRYIEERRKHMAGSDPLLFDALGAYVDMLAFAQLDTLSDLKHRYRRR